MRCIQPYDYSLPGWDAVDLSGTLQQLVERRPGHANANTVNITKLAARIGVYPACISRWWHGKTRVRCDYTYALAKGLGIEHSELMAGSACAWAPGTTPRGGRRMGRPPVVSSKLEAAKPKLERPALSDWDRQRRAILADWERKEAEAARFRQNVGRPRWRLDYVS